ncbi:unnamed protein product, partial [Pocillopora meandrina]
MEVDKGTSFLRANVGGARDSEKTFRAVKVIVNGIPNKVYSKKMETKDMSEEVFIRFRKENSLDLLRLQNSLGQGQQSGLSGPWHEVPHSPPLKELADGEKKHN